jgi:EmrB/QacA subfamily drug resistance transporter
LADRPLRKNLILFVVGIGQLMIVLDLTIVNVALENIRTTLRVDSAADLQWVVTGYAVVFGGFLLLGGKLADRFGRRRIFVTGALVFAVASLLGGLATSLGMLIAARALQGFGASLMSPAALAILAVAFAAGRERDRALSVWAAISAGGAALGLLLGGFLTEYADWRWVFFVNVPIALFAVVAAFRILPETKDEHTRKFDVLGAVLVTLGLMAFVYGLVNGNRQDWDLTIVLTLVGAAILIGAFVVRVARAGTPLIPRDLLRHRSLVGSVTTGLFAASGLFAVFFFLVLWIRQVKGWTPLDTGFAFLPVTIFVIVGAAIASVTIGRVGPRVTGTIGPLLAAAGLFYVGLGLTPEASYAGLVLPGAMLLGVGMGLVFVSLTTSALARVPPDQTGIASALLNSSQQVGGALGLGILTAVATWRTNSAAPQGPPALGADGLPLDAAAAAAYIPAQVEGWALALAVASAFLVAAAIVMATVIRLKPGEMEGPGFRS